MYGSALLALATAASALPTTVQKLERRALTDENLFICPSSAPQGGCSLGGNPYYVNQATTGDVVADLLGIWECPTTYDQSNITALCCSGFSHNGDYDYSTWCETPTTTDLATSELLSSGDLDLGSFSDLTDDSALSDFVSELEDALKELDLETAQSELESATGQFDASTLDDLLSQLTSLISTETLAADLAEVTDAA